MKPGMGIYVFDSKCKLLLVQKSDSKFGKNPETGKPYWLVPGTTKRLKKLREARKIDEKQEIAKNDHLKREIIFPDGSLGACCYVGRWLYNIISEGKTIPYFFDNFVVHINDLDDDSLKLLTDRTISKKTNGISKIQFFDLFELPMKTLSPLTAGFLKSLLFQSPSELTTDITIEQEKDFADITRDQKNRFFLYQRVTGGTYGAVYKVLDIPTLLPKAIKTAIPALTDEKWRERFILEGTTLMRLRQLSPELDNSIERIFSINQIDDKNEKYFLVKNWVSGNTLEKEIDDSGREFLVDELIIDIMKEIIKTLKAIHSLEKPICHRDLKPNNIMISFDKKKKKTKKLILIDFGLCKNKEVYTGTSDEFHVGNRIYQSVHTVNYYNEHNAIDDYYSALQIFYWLLFGVNPYAIKWEKILKDKRKGEDKFLKARSSIFKVKGKPKSSKLFQRFFGIIKKYYSYKRTYYVRDSVQKEFIEKIHNLFS